MHQYVEINGVCVLGWPKLYYCKKFNLFPDKEKISKHISIILYVLLYYLLNYILYYCIYTLISYYSNIFGHL